MKRSWIILAKSIWCRPWCPSHKFISLPLGFPVSLLFFRLAVGVSAGSRLLFSVRNCCCADVLSVMGSSRKCVKKRRSVLSRSTSHIHMESGFLPYGISLFHTVRTWQYGQWLFFNTLLFHSLSRRHIIFSFLLNFLYVFIYVAY